MEDDDSVFRADAELVKVAEGCRFTEGPACDAEGSLFFSDAPNDRIMVLRPDGSCEVWRTPSGRANGMNFDPQGRLVTCCSQGEGGARAVQRYESDGSVTVLASTFNGKRLNSPNDLCFDPEGRIYFTDPRYGDRSDIEQDKQAVYRIEPDGSAARVIDDLETPNGILMTPDGRTLYLVDNNPDEWGARKLLSYCCTEENEWLLQADMYDFSPGRGGDGMVLDVAGNIYLAAGSGEAGGIYVFSRDGAYIEFVPVPEAPTNCTFGGAEMTTLYVTANTSVYAVEGTVRGQLAYPR